jgi:hypothetical protein
MGKINITKFKILMQRWKDLTYLGDINKLNLLADETINLVNSEPLLKDICEIFMYAVSVKMMNDPNNLANTLANNPVGPVNNPVSGDQQQFRRIAR